MDDVENSLIVWNCVWCGWYFEWNKLEFLARLIMKVLCMHYYPVSVRKIGSCQLHGPRSFSRTFGHVSKRAS